MEKYREMHNCTPCICKQWMGQRNFGVLEQINSFSSFANSNLDWKKKRPGGGWGEGSHLRNFIAGTMAHKTKEGGRSTA